MRSALIKTEYEVICMLNDKEDELEITQKSLPSEYWDFTFRTNDTVSSLPLLWPPNSGGIQWSITRTHATSWPNTWAHLAAWHNEHQYVDSDTQQVTHLTLMICNHRIESPSYVQEDIILNAAPEIRKFNSIHKCFSSPACDSHLLPSSTNQTSLNISVLIFSFVSGQDICKLCANYNLKKKNELLTFNSIAQITNFSYTNPKLIQHFC